MSYLGLTRGHFTKIDSGWLGRFYIVDGSRKQRKISPDFRSKEEATEHLQALRATYPSAYLISAQYSPTHYHEDGSGNLMRKSPH